MSINLQGVNAASLNGSVITAITMRATGSGDPYASVGLIGDPRVQFKPLVMRGDPSNMLYCVGVEVMVAFTIMQTEELYELSLLNDYSASPVNGLYDTSVDILVYYESGRYLSLGGATLPLRLMPVYNAGGDSIDNLRVEGDHTVSPDYIFPLFGP